MLSGPILIVDDEKANLATLNEILAGDYPVAFARSGAEALIAARKHQPTLILLDIQMPDMDGYAVCRALKAQPATENIPVIFVSALANVGDEAAGFESGCVDYLVKPVSPEIVRARVRSHLSLVRASVLERYIVQLEAQQAKISRLSRIHEVLGGINSLIVRTRERQVLLDEACRILVDCGGFANAWIGIVDAASDQLVPVAFHGEQSSQLIGITDRFTLANPGATGELGLLDQAFSTGNASFRNDVRATPPADNICLEAARRDMLSVAALPLTHSTNATNVIGVMVLYAGEAEYFDEPELKLLSELAADISFGLEHIDQDARLRYLSCYDALTGLPNSVLLHDCVSQAIARAAESNQADCLALLVFDLDRFTQLNDTLGRHVGDRLLKHVAECLGRSLPRQHYLARIGADTFAVALTGLQSGAEAALILQQQLYLPLAEPVILDGHEIRLSARAGIALYPGDGTDGNTLFKNAEAALKLAQGSGDSYLYYRPEINARVASLVRLESELRSAIEREEFVVYYQPKVDLRSGLITSSEALIRWKHPVRGMVPPGEFIPLAEESGLVLAMGEWILRATCAQQAAWRRAGCPIVPVAVNVSAIQFRQGQVCEQVRQALAQNDLAAEYLELELTESALVEDKGQTKATLDELKAMGIQLALDDFGTGYSSLSYLQRFPINMIKIDRSFVMNITSDSDSGSLAKAIIAIAHQLNMQALAEGVETESQLNYMIEHGCDQMQGYYFSRPVPADEFEAMLRGGKRLSLNATALAEP